MGNYQETGKELQYTLLVTANIKVHYLIVRQLNL